LEEGKAANEVVASPDGNNILVGAFHGAESLVEDDSAADFTEPMEPSEEENTENEIVTFRDRASVLVRLFYDGTSDGVKYSVASSIGRKAPSEEGKAGVAVPSSFDEFGIAYTGADIDGGTASCHNSVVGGRLINIAEQNTPPAGVETVYADEGPKLICPDSATAYQPSKIGSEIIVLEVSWKVHGAFDPVYRPMVAARCDELWRLWLPGPLATQTRAIIPTWSTASNTKESMSCRSFTHQAQLHQIAAVRSCNEAAEPAGCEHVRQSRVDIEGALGNVPANCTNTTKERSRIGLDFGVQAKLPVENEELMIVKPSLGSRKRFQTSIELMEVARGKPPTVSFADVQRQLAPGALPWPVGSNRYRFVVGIGIDESAEWSTGTSDDIAVAFGPHLQPNIDQQHHSGSSIIRYCFNNTPFEAGEGIETIFETSELTIQTIGTTAITTVERVGKIGDALRVTERGEGAKKPFQDIVGATAREYVNLMRDVYAVEPGEGTSNPCLVTSKAKSDSPLTWQVDESNPDREWKTTLLSGSKRTQPRSCPSTLGYRGTASVDWSEIDPGERYTPTVDWSNERSRPSTCEHWDTAPSDWSEIDPGEQTDWLALKLMSTATKAVVSMMASTRTKGPLQMEEGTATGRIFPSGRIGASVDIVPIARRGTTGTLLDLTDAPTERDELTASHLLPTPMEESFCPTSMGSTPTESLGREQQIWRKEQLGGLKEKLAMSYSRSIPTLSSIVHNPEDRGLEARLSKPLPLFRSKHACSNRIGTSSACETTDRNNYLEIHPKFDVQLDRGEEVPKPFHIHLRKNATSSTSLMVKRAEEKTLKTSNLLPGTVTPALMMGINESFPNILFTTMESSHPRLMEYETCCKYAIQTEVDGNAKYDNVWQSLAKTGRGSKSEKADHTENNVCLFSKRKATRNLWVPRSKVATVYDPRQCVKPLLTQQYNDYCSNSVNAYGHIVVQVTQKRKHERSYIVVKVSEEEAYSYEDDGLDYIQSQT